MLKLTTKSSHPEEVRDLKQIQQTHFRDISQNHIISIIILISVYQYKYHTNTVLFIHGITKYYCVALKYIFTLFNKLVIINLHCRGGWVKTNQYDTWHHPPWTMRVSDKTSIIFCHTNFPEMNGGISVFGATKLNNPKGGDSYQ